MIARRQGGKTSKGDCVPAALTGMTRSRVEWRKYMIKIGRDGTTKITRRTRVTEITKGKEDYLGKEG